MQCSKGNHINSIAAYAAWAQQEATGDQTRQPDVRFTPESGHRLAIEHVRFVPQADICSAAESELI
jgi:hypothetical protein